MALLTATISGGFDLPDLTPRTRLRVIIEAVGATGGVVKSATDNVVISGRYIATIQDDGTLPITLPQLPQTNVVPVGARWRARFEIAGNNETPPPATVEFNLTGNTTWAALVDVSGTPVSQAVVDLVQQAAADAIAARDAAIAARDAAQAVGSTNDTIITSRINDPASQTRAALNAAMAVRKLDEFTGAAATADDSATIAAAFTAARAGGFALRATAGKTYRGHGLNPTGTFVDWRGAILKVPDTVTALTVFTPTGAFRTIGGEFNGNKANTTDGGSDTTSCGVYLYSTAGWAGQVRMEGGPIFHDFWRHGTRFVSANNTSAVAITDAKDAQPSAVYLENPEAYSCKIGLYAYGLSGYETRGAYTHNNAADGNYWALCKAPRQTGIRSHFNGGHGAVSSYSVDDYVDAQTNDNTGGGLVFGGGSTTFAAGTGYQVASLTARRNGTGTNFAGLVLDPTIAGSPGIVVPVNAQIGPVLSTGNAGAGIQVTCAQYVDFTTITADNNTGPGLALATSDVSYVLLRARNNGSYGIAEFGNATRPNYGRHRHGRYVLSGNALGGADPYVESSSVATSTYTVEQASSRTSTAVPSRNPQGPDQGLIGWSYDAVEPTTSTVIGAGVAQVVLVPIRTATSITNILLYVAAAGATLTAGQCLAALYQNGTLLGVTADQSASWNNSGLKTMALTGGPFPVVPGFVQVVFWANGTTPPGVARTSNLPILANAGLAVSASRFGTADTALTTTAPATLGAVAARQVPFWVAVN